MKNWLIWKDPDAGKDWRQEEKGTTENEMVAWHHRLNGHEFGWTPGVGDGQGGLACCGSWGCKESDMTERLNWTETSNLLPLFKIDFPPLRVNLSEQRKGHHQCWGWGEARGVGSLSFFIKHPAGSGTTPSAIQYLLGRGCEFWGENPFAFMWEDFFFACESPITKQLVSLEDSVLQKNPLSPQLLILRTGLEFWRAGNWHFCRICFWSQNQPGWGRGPPPLEARPDLQPHQHYSVVQGSQGRNPRGGKGLRPAGSCWGTALKNPNTFIMFSNSVLKWTPLQYLQLCEGGQFDWGGSIYKI